VDAHRINSSVGISVLVPLALTSERTPDIPNY